MHEQIVENERTWKTVTDNLKDAQVQKQSDSQRSHLQAPNTFKGISYLIKTAVEAMGVNLRCRKCIYLNKKFIDTIFDSYYAYFKNQICNNI